MKSIMLIQKQTICGDEWFFSVCRYICLNESVIHKDNADINFIKITNYIGTK